MINLREGLSVIVGHKRNGSAYYLVDDVLDREYHISQEFASWLKGFKSNKQKIEIYKQFLEHNKLLDTDVAVQPKQPLTARLLSWSFDVFNPTNLLTKNKKIWEWLFSRVGYVLLLMLWLFVIMIMKGSWNEFTGYTSRYYSSSTAIIVGLIATKLLHELGHAAALVKNGAKVRNIGVIFIAFFPLPKTLAHRVCMLSPAQRIQVALAGIYIEAWVGAICSVIWVLIDNGPLRVVAHFLAVVSLGVTVTLNLLPLMKFDGYQVLSGALDSPKLYENALSVFRARVYALAGKKAVTERISSNVSDMWLFFYGAAIFVWRITLPVAIGSGVVLMFGRPGILVAGLAIFVMLIKPGHVEFNRFLKAEKKDHYMVKKIILAVLIFLVITWFVVPLKHVETYKGAIVLEQKYVIAQVDGVLTRRTKEGLIKKNKRLINITVTDDSNLEQKNYLDDETLLSINAIERENFHLLSNISEQRENLLRRQTAINSDVQGYWEPAKYKSNVRAGDLLGRLYTDKATIRAFLPADQFSDDNYIAVILAPGQSAEKIKLEKISKAINLDLLPKWMQLDYQNYIVYEANYEKGKFESPVDVYIKKEYSIIFSMLKRMYLRIM